MLSDDELWRLTSEAQTELESAQAAHRAESTEATRARLLKADSEFRRLTNMWQARTRGES